MVGNRSACQSCGNGGARHRRGVADLRHCCLAFLAIMSCDSNIISLMCSSISVVTSVVVAMAALVSIVVSFVVAALVSIVVSFVIMSIVVAMAALVSIVVSFIFIVAVVALLF